MDQDLRFDVALSYSAKDAWIGKDLFSLITQYGFSAYSYHHKTENTRGFLRSKLLDIYRDSSLNVLMWSATYATNTKESFLAMEQRCITTRHIEKGEAESLFLLLTDDTPLPRDLTDLLHYRLQDEGLIGVSSIIVSRLKKLYSQYTEFGTIQHPLSTEAARGPLHPCSFSIDLTYHSDKLGRWNKLGDVLVHCSNPLGTRYVYLIPSGGCSPLLRHSRLLKDDPTLLEHKRQFTRKFVEEWQDRLLQGYWFRMRVGEIEVATVYSAIYDKFLNTSLQHLPNMP